MRLDLLRNPLSSGSLWLRSVPLLAMALTATASSQPVLVVRPDSFEIEEISYDFDIEISNGGSGELVITDLIMEHNYSQCFRGHGFSWDASGITIPATIEARGVPLRIPITYSAGDVASALHVGVLSNGGSFAATYVGYLVFTAEGSVFEAVTSVPIQNATVILSHRSAVLRDETDQAGRFSIRYVTDCEVDQLNLTAEANGYAPEVLNWSGYGFEIIHDFYLVRFSPTPTATPTPRVVYVAGDATGTADGSSWENAFTSLSAGLTDSASGDEIWVKAGVYEEPITLGEGVSVYGGFQGIETARGDRDPNRNTTTIDAGGQGSAVTGADGATIDGFIIRGGSAERGGGINCTGGPTVVTNCVITENTGDYGGGVHGEAVLANCIIVWNRATYAGGGVEGRALLTNCAIVANTILGSGSNGGVSGRAVITNCIVSENRSGQVGWQADVTWSAVQGGSEGEGNISEDPQFVCPWNGVGADLHLRQGSPCIDGGNPLVALNDRCLPPGLGGERNDMGAYGGPGNCLGIPEIPVPTQPVLRVSPARGITICNSPYTFDIRVWNNGGGELVVGGIDIWHTYGQGLYGEGFNWDLSEIPIPATLEVGGPALAIPIEFDWTNESDMSGMWVCIGSDAGHYSEIYIGCPNPGFTPMPDADGDGIYDSFEAAFPAAGQTNMYLPDSDGDGLSDGVEDTNRNGVHLEFVETDPRDRNTDGDDVEDGVELDCGGSFDPLDPWSQPTPSCDIDNDALPLRCDPDENDPDVDDDRFLDGYEATHIGHNAVSDPNAIPGMGDIDLNDIWDNGDAQLILNFFAHTTIPDGIAGADLDRNAIIDNADAQQSLNFFADWTPYLPAR